MARPAASRSVTVGLVAAVATAILAGGCAAAAHRAGGTVTPAADSTAVVTPATTTLGPATAAATTPAGSTAAATTPGPATARPASLAALGFAVASRGSAGGAIWLGRIPNREVPGEQRRSAVYVPPRYDPAHRRYPVVYLLHGLPGSPSGFVHSLDLAGVADRLIEQRQAPPFLAVMPVAGPKRHPGQSEWAGPWEDFVVRDVVPWADANLATDPRPAARALAGLSAGGFGAVDIGLRHPGLFATLESWNGYFRPFRDGAYRHASAAVLAASTPTLLVRSLQGGDGGAPTGAGAPAGRSATARPVAPRFFLSTGPRHGEVDPNWTLDFARELAGLGLSYRLWTLPPGQTTGFYRAQLPAALEYALAATAPLVRPPGSRPPGGSRLTATGRR